MSLLSRAIPSFATKTSLGSRLQVRNFSHLMQDLHLPDLLQEKRNNSIIFTLNNPKYLNAATSEMVSLMNSSLKELDKNINNIDMLFIRGIGRSLSAGADLKVMAAGAQDSQKTGVLEEFLDNVYKSLFRLKTLKMPTISLMDGPTVGFGGGLGFCSNLKIATENTVHAMPETRIGHFCDGSSSYHLSRLRGNYGIYLALCAEKSKAEDLIYSGIATHYIPSARLVDMIHHLTELNLRSTSQINHELNRFTERLPTMNRLTSTKEISQQEKHSIVESCFKYDTVEGIVHALEREGSQFALGARENILLGSPTSTKITLELLRRAATLSFKECMLLERKLWSLDIGTHDFAEGCSSKLGKRAPQWRPNRLEDLNVTDIHANHFNKADSVVPVDFYA